MPPPYKQPQWSDFSSIPYSPQKDLGQAPADWAHHFAIHDEVPDATKLPTVRLDRVQVRNICQDPRVDVLHGYVCAMAWGRQDKITGGGGRSNVEEAWVDRGKLSVILGKLRVGGLTRQEAYRLFLGANNKNAVSGLGPSFFTKLLYFFSRNVPPQQEPYIVDNMILGRLTRLTGLPFSSKASCGGYQASCWEIDQMVPMLSWTIPNPDGSHVEERLFSWDPGAVISRLSYRQKTMFTPYSHLGMPVSDF